MYVIYDSLTGQTKKMALSVDKNAINIKQVQDIDGDCLLITRSVGFGQITKSARKFVERYQDKIKGVAVSGNRNWGSNYGAAGDKLAEEFDLNLILKFEASGMKEDVEFLKNWIIEHSEGE